MIIPYAQFITADSAEAVIQLKKAGFPVIFIDDLPIGVVDGDNKLLGELSHCKVVTLDALVNELKRVLFGTSCGTCIPYAPIFTL